MDNCIFEKEDVMCDELRKLVRSLINMSHDDTMGCCEDFTEALCCYISASVAEGMRRKGDEIENLKGKIRDLERRLRACERVAERYADEKREYWDKVCEENERHRRQSGLDDYEYRTKTGRYNPDNKYY